MPSSDWLINIAGNINWDLTTPGLSGTKSLRLFAGNAGTSYGDITVTEESGFARGHTTGRLRSAFRATGNMSPTSPNNVFGLFWLSDEATPMATVGTRCYGALVEYNRITLRKNAGSTLLGQADILTEVAIPYTPGTLVTLQATWEVLTPTEIRMRIARGTALTYTDLVEVIDYTDPGTTYADTAVVEGCTCRQGAVSDANFMQFTFDRTALYHQAA